MNHAETAKNALALARAGRAVRANFAAICPITGLAWSVDDLIRKTEDGRWIPNAALAAVGMTLNTDDDSYNFHPFARFDADVAYDLVLKGHDVRVYQSRGGTYKTFSLVNGVLCANGAGPITPVQFKVRNRSAALMVVTSARRTVWS